MNRADAVMVRGATKLQRIADQAAARGGVVSKLAKPLASDAVLLRRMKPSLIAARVKGEAPTNLPPGEGTVAPGGPQLGKRPKKGGPNPFLVLAISAAAGVGLAKLLDWRGHAHPRD